MLEGLPPNNAAHLLRLVCGEREARAVADLIVESFEPAEAASTAFRDRRALAGGRQGLAGGKAYFGFAPDEESVRELVALAAGEGQCGAGRVWPDRKARLGRQCARRSSAGAGRALSRPWRA